MQYPAMNVGRLGALASALVVLLFAVPEVGYARAPCSAANPNDNISDDAALNACFAGRGLFLFLFIVERGSTVRV